MHNNWQNSEALLIKEDCVPFKGTDRWSVRSTSLLLNERAKGVIEYFFCAGCYQTADIRNGSNRTYISNNPYLNLEIPPF